jgi:hypothetical protein
MNLVAPATAGQRVEERDELDVPVTGEPRADLAAGQLLSGEQAGNALAV